MRKEIHARPYGASSLSRRVNSFIFYALLLLIVLAPIPYGSNRAWSWSLCAFIISVLSLVWVINAFREQRSVSLSLPPLIISLFLIPCLWVLLQVSGFLPETMFHPLWGLAAEVLDAPQPAISLTPDMSLTALMRLMSYALVFFLVFQFCHNPHRAHTTLKWLAVAGTLYALYGLVVYWGNFHVLFWMESEGDIKSVSSTFINRNTYVDYAGMGLLCLMALSLSHSKQRRGPQGVPTGGRQERIESFIFDSWKPFLGLMIISSALISTQSRGGAVACAIGVATFLGVYLVRKKTDTKMLMASLGGMCLIIALAYSISNEVLLKRMVKVDTGGAERITVFKLTIDATRDNPLTGFGYGAFEQGFKTYRNEDVEHLYDKTHNTYLENAFELGVAAALSLVLSLLGLFLLCLWGVFRRKRNWIYPATGLAATTLVASHALFDFSLQIPAVAITYAAIMGLAVAQSFSSTRHPA